LGPPDAPPCGVAPPVWSLPCQCPPLGRAFPKLRWDRRKHRRPSVFHWGGGLRSVGALGHARNQTTRPRGGWVPSREFGTDPTRHLGRPIARWSPCLGARKDAVEEPRAGKARSEALEGRRETPRILMEGFSPMASEAFSPPSGAFSQDEGGASLWGDGGTPPLPSGWRRCCRSSATPLLTPHPRGQLPTPGWGTA